MRVFGVLFGLAVLLVAPAFGADRPEDAAQAVETVTPMVDSDGAWRVSGYFIR